MAKRLVGFKESVVLGLEDVRSKLLSLPTKLSTNIIRRGLLAGAGVIRDEARRNAPQPPGRSTKGNERRGLLAKSIVAATKRQRGSNQGRTVYAAVVSVRKPGKSGDVSDSELREGGRRTGRGPNPRSYAHLVEFGTRPHAVGKGSDLEQVIKGPGFRVRGAGKQRGAKHPGIPAQEFLTKAFDTKRDEAVKRIAEVVRSELAKELKKMGRSRS